MNAENPAPSDAHDLAKRLVEHMRLQGAAAAVIPVIVGDEKYEVYVDHITVRGGRESVNPKPPRRR